LDGVSSRASPCHIAGSACSSFQPCLEIWDPMIDLCDKNTRTTAGSISMHPTVENSAVLAKAHRQHQQIHQSIVAAHQFHRRRQTDFTTARELSDAYFNGAETSAARTNGQETSDENNDLLCFGTGGRNRLTKHSHKHKTNITYYGVN
jgi:hypothetical protein